MDVYAGCFLFVCFFASIHSSRTRMSGSFDVRVMECMCAQTRCQLILSSERVLENGVRIYVNSKGKMPSTEGSEESNLWCYITQDSKPNILPTELFRPPMWGSIQFSHSWGFCHITRPSMKTECDYLYGWVKKTVTYAKISPKNGKPQRYSWEHRRRSLGHGMSHAKLALNCNEHLTSTSIVHPQQRSFSSTSVLPQWNTFSKHTIPSK